MQIDFVSLYLGGSVTEVGRPLIAPKTLFSRLNDVMRDRCRSLGLGPLTEDLSLEEKVAAIRAAVVFWSNFFEEKFGGRADARDFVAAYKKLATLAEKVSWKKNFGPTFFDRGSEGQAAVIAAFKVARWVVYYPACEQWAGRPARSIAEMEPEIIPYLLDELGIIRFYHFDTKEREGLGVLLENAVKYREHF